MTTSQAVLHAVRYVATMATLHAVMEAIIRSAYKRSRANERQQGHKQGQQQPEGKGACQGLQQAEGSSSGGSMVGRLGNAIGTTSRVPTHCGQEGSSGSDLHSLIMTADTCSLGGPTGWEGYAEGGSGVMARSVSDPTSLTRPPVESEPHHRAAAATAATAANSPGHAGHEGSSGSTSGVEGSSGIAAGAASSLAGATGPAVSSERGWEGYACPVPCDPDAYEEYVPAPRPPMQVGHGPCTVRCICRVCP